MRDGTACWANAFGPRKTPAADRAADTATKSIVSFPPIDGNAI
jgi:hypothetical protein